MTTEPSLAPKFRTRYVDAIWGENALRPPERLVALAYAKYAGARDAKTGEPGMEDVSWVEWSTLTVMTGIRSKTTLSKTTQALVAAGWMVLVEAPKQHRAPRYRLRIPANPAVRVTVICEEEAS